MRRRDFLKGLAAVVGCGVAGGTAVLVKCNELDRTKVWDSHCIPNWTYEEACAGWNAKDPNWPRQPITPAELA